MQHVKSSWLANKLVLKMGWSVAWISWRRRSKKVTRQFQRNERRMFPCCSWFFLTKLRRNFGWENKWTLKVSLMWRCFSPILSGLLRSAQAPHHSKLSICWNLSTGFSTSFAESSTSIKSKRLVTLIALQKVWKVAHPQVNMTLIKLRSWRWRWLKRVLNM